MPSAACFRFTRSPAHARYEGEFSIRTVSLNSGRIRKRQAAHATGFEMPVAWDRAKPFHTLDAIAKSFGWRGLLLWRQDLLDRPPVHWYQTTDPKFMLWITEYPLGQNDVFAATVYADRYGICSGQHRCALTDRASILALGPWITRDLFRDPAWRRQLSSMCPECVAQRRTPRYCTEKRSRGEWPPYAAYETKPTPPPMNR